PSGRVAVVDDTAELTVVAGALVVAGVCYYLCPSITDAIVDAGTTVYHKITGRGQEPGSRSGKDFTRKGKEIVKDENKKKYGGVQTCNDCKRPTSPSEQSKKGVTPPDDETAVDHKDPKSKGGSGTPENGEVLCRRCNGQKSDKIRYSDPSPPPPPPPPPPPAADPGLQLPWTVAVTPAYGDLGEMAWRRIA